MKPSFLYDICSSCKSIHVTDLGESVSLFQNVQGGIAFHFQILFVHKNSLRSKTVQNSYFKLQEVVCPYLPQMHIFQNTRFSNQVHTST
jgi:hypothetical protein